MAKRSAIVGICLAAAGIMTSGTASAQSSDPSKKSLSGTNTVTSAVPFLRISPDARSGAMGDVGVAISPDANSQHWNLSKIPFAAKKYGISATYTPWLKDLGVDIFLAYLSGYAKFGPENNQAVSASLRYFSLGEINYTDFNAQPLGTGKPNELAFDLGYSRKLSPNLSTGIGFRYIRSAIASGFNSATSDYRPGNAFGADLGVFYTKTTEIDEFRSNNLSLGAVISNLGTKISYNANRQDFIPTNLGLGGAYTFQPDEYNKVTFALDINKLLVPTPQPKDDGTGNIIMEIPNKAVVPALFSSFGDAPGGFSEEIKEYQVSLGAEYWYQNQFAARAGYFYENKDKGNRKYFTVGLGVRYNIFNLNFAYLVPSGNGINRNPLSNTFRFSLMFEFDELKKNENNTTTP
jgi:hypothetical protein